MNRLLTIGALVVGLVIGTLAIAAAGAQEDTPTPAPATEEDGDSPRDRYKDKLAENLGISTEDLEAAIKQTHLDLIDEALADGRIDEEKAAELRERVESGEPLFPHRRHQGHPGHGRGLHWIADSVKDILGLEDGDIREAYADGKSIADLAEEKGVSTDDLKAQILEDAESTLGEKVADGDITQEEADAKLERLANNIDNIINHVPPQFTDGEEGLRFGGSEGGSAPVPLFEADEAATDA